MQLSPQEKDVLTLIACGFSDKEIGVKLCLSQRTVQTYISRIIMKLDARNRTNAAIIYLKKHPNWKIGERFISL